MHFITYVKKLGTHRLEILLGISIVVNLCLLIFLIRSSQGIPYKEDKSASVPAPTRGKEISAEIYVEISGAVYKPGVYPMKKGARLYSLLEEAGGLNKQADKGFFYRNYNQARLLEDGEKIHAPSLEEVARGAFLEQPLIIYTNEIGTTEPVVGKAGDQGQEGKSGLISINSATTSELETLTGVGKVTSEKIVAGRPYTAIEELKTKEVVSESLYSKIESYISL
jgi:competence protein ComEA